jgi:hypothetical protein
VSLFFHVHTDACDPVCILKQLGEQYVFTVDPRPLLYDDPASVERLAAALESELPDFHTNAEPLNGLCLQCQHYARAIIAALVAEEAK